MGKALPSYCLYFNFNYNEGKFIVHLSYVVKTKQSHVLENPASVPILTSHSPAALGVASRCPRAGPTLLLERCISLNMDFSS